MIVAFRFQSWDFRNNLWAPAVILPVLLGLRWYREETIYPVIASMLVGLGTAIVWLALHQPFQLEGSVAGFLAAVLTYVVSRPLLKSLPLVALVAVA